MGSHRIKPNHSIARPVQMIFLDTETKWGVDPPGSRGRLHELRLGVAKSGRLEKGELTRTSECFFRSRKQFWDYLSTVTVKGQTTWIVAHNMHFDWTVLGGWNQLFDGLLQFDWPGSKRRGTDIDITDKGHPWRYCVLDAPPWIVGTIDNLGRRCLWLDTMNYWRTTLAQLGQSVGIAKLPMPNAFEDDNTWFKYCARDVDIVVAAFTQLLQWWGENDYGKFRYSAPGLAMAAYRHRFLHPDILVHDDPVLKEFERQAYYGGRIEPYRVGRIIEPCVEIDVNSLYPYIMKTKPVPHRLIECASNLHWQRGRMPFSPINSIAEVMLSTDSVPYPKRTKRAVFYPIGQYSTTLAGPELMAADRAGHIVAWRSWATYACAVLFKDYVDHFYNLKSESKKSGNETQYAFAKMLLNSLYGKFGQCDSVWTEAPKVPAKDAYHTWIEYGPDANDLNVYRSVGWQTFKQQPKVASERSFPAIAAFVTSWARMYMSEIKDFAGPSQVYYENTDSLILRGDAYKRLELAGWIDKVAIGKLKMIDSRPEVTIFGPNDLMFGPRIIKAGFHPTEQEFKSGIFKRVSFESMNQTVGHLPAGGIYEQERVVRRRRLPWKCYIDSQHSCWPIRLHAAEDAELTIDHLIERMSPDDQYALGDDWSMAAW